MKNKLGVSYTKLIQIETEIVNLKLNLLDEYFTFNENIFSLKYLRKLHKFLFSDLYENIDVETRELNDIEKDYIQDVLISLENICIKEPIEIDKVLQIILKLWDFQIFKDGNTRTMLAYLKVINRAFLLDLDIDLNSVISNQDSDNFKKEKYVNQKRLTKSK